jgi:predicted MFS family arabinose efflux permease
VPQEDRLEHSSQTRPHNTLREGPLLAVLAIVQFTTMLDFLIMMPLGPQYMRVFQINPAQFGTIVSAYAICAGIAGLISGTFLDRFDRRHSLLVLYTGFGLATLACALAPGYLSLTAARGLAGAFGGVSNAVILAIIGDIIPEQRRGRAMGIVMSSFSVASVLGVPIGLYLANAFSWHAPFFMLAAVSAVVLAGQWFFVPHIKSKSSDTHAAPVAHLVQIISGPGHVRAFAFIGTVVLAGFLVVPYISPYMVLNVGLLETELPYIYLAGGLCTIFSMNIIGRMSDRFGKRRLFTIMAISAAASTLVLTNLRRVGTPLAITSTTFFMICMSGRFVPAMAIMTSAVEQRLRGGFMSVCSAVQHIASGLGSYIGGLILVETNSGRLHGYSTIGYLSAALAILSLVLCFRLPPPAGSVSPELLEPIM